MSEADSQASADRAQQSLREHISTIASSAFQQYGPSLDYPTIQKVLLDRKVVRYPVTIVFDSGNLRDGEFAFAKQRGENSADGFTLFIHPLFENEEENIPLLIAYHLVCINYGDIVGSREAELFGATLLGMDIDLYYQKLCALADRLAVA